MPGAYAKNSEKIARPKAECTAAAEKAVRGSPATAAAVRGSPAKVRRRAGKPRQSPPPCGEAPPKRPLAANRAEYKKSGGSYDPPFAWFIFVSLLKTNISLALVI